jgi:DNA-binding GntR family transcriptional regulator
VTSALSVVDSAYAKVRTLIVTGDLEPGSRLAELPLAKRLGVSRPTVREVLRRLEVAGLALSDGRGLRAAWMDDRKLRSALLMRASLEGLHAELAAQRVAAGEISPAQLRRLEATADEAQKATDAGDADAAIIANRAFHQMIDEMTDSPLSCAAVDTLWDRILAATKASLDPPERRRQVSREHGDLIRAIRVGEAANAAQIASAHVRSTLDAVTPTPPTFKSPPDS